MFQLQEKQFPQPGYNLTYYTQGDPRHELLIFIHSAFGDHTCFHHQVEPFAQQYRVLCVDMLGHGKSQTGDSAVTLEKMADLVAGIMDKEGHSQAHLVGVSLGSLVSQYIADRYPEKIKTVTVVGGYNIFGDNKAITRSQGAEIFKWFFLLVFAPERFRRHIVKGTNWVDAERDVYYQAMRPITLRSLRPLSGMGKLLDKAPKRLRQPLFIVVGEHDLPVIFKTAAEWHKSEPNSRYAVIREAGHCANMDNPAAFNQLLAEFLAQP